MKLYYSVSKTELSVISKANNKNFDFAQLNLVGQNQNTHVNIENALAVEAVHFEYKNETFYPHEKGFLTDICLINAIEGISTKHICLNEKAYNSISNYFDSNQEIYELYPVYFEEMPLKYFLIIFHQNIDFLSLINYDASKFNKLLIDNKYNEEKINIEKMSCSDLENYYKNIGKVLEEGKKVIYEIESLVMNSSNVDIIFEPNFYLTSKITFSQKIIDILLENAVTGLHPNKVPIISI